MKIKQIIPNNKTIPGLAKYIKTHCKEILSIYRIVLPSSGYPLYSGQNGYDKVAFVSESPKNRKPKDVPIEIHTFVDEKLKGAGFTAVRSNSIFCTTVRSIASSYGDSYVIFPFDGFSFTTSSIFDLFMVDENIFKKKYQTMSPAKFVKMFNFKKDNLAKILKDNTTEILIHGKYVAVRATHNQELFEQLGITGMM